MARRPLAARLALGAAGAAGVLLGGALFLTALAAKERDNRFCVSCHLHDEKFLRLTSSRPTDLAGFHQAKKADLGCIACHGGADPIMRLKVWTVAAFDTLRFLAGTYREPTQMRLPLRDAECRPCHTPILAASASSNQGAPPAASVKPTDAADESAVAEAATEGRGGTSYHAIREHQTVRIACVRCHTSHTTDANAADKFLSRPRITAICRDCHQEM